MPAKFNLLAAASLTLLPVIPLLACGGDSKSPDASIHVQDSGSNGSNGSAHCEVTASLGTPTITQSGAGYTAGSAADKTNLLEWQGVIPNTNPVQVLDVLIASNCGTTGTACPNGPTPDWPTTFAPKSGIDLGPASDASVAVLTDAGSDNRFRTFYLSTAGTLNITSASNTAGAKFAGNFSNVTVAHFDPGSNGFTADPDGCMSTITSYSFDGSATAQFNGKSLIDPAQLAEVHAALLHRWR
jgi:hypothetical protein